MLLCRCWLWAPTEPSRQPLRRWMPSVVRALMMAPAATMRCSARCLRSSISLTVLMRAATSRCADRGAAAATTAFAPLCTYAPERLHMRPASLPIAFLCKLPRLCWPPPPTGSHGDQQTRHTRPGSAETWSPGPQSGVWAARSGESHPDIPGTSNPLLPLAATTHMVL
jgi:hypothetical protein